MSPSFRTRLLWLVVWLLTRGLIVAQVGFWNDATGVQLEDVNVFQAWSDYIAANHALPVEDSWQYPPGAAFLMLLPRIGGDFGESFVATMLLFDLLGLTMTMLLAARYRRETGVWVWLLAMPLLFTLPVLRFDLVPTAIAVAALVAIHRHPTWFGVLVGLGAMVKVWPAVVLLGEWDRRRLVRSLAAAIAVVGLLFAISALAFGDQSSFFSGQSARGLQVEAVGSSPWHLRQIVTGEPPFVVQRFGTNEIGSGPADAVADLLKWLAVAVLVAAAAWWWARDRAIRRGRTDLADTAIARDFVFTLVLLLVVTSRVLSPQFMIWLVGLSAVVLTAGTTRLARPAWVIVGAIVLSAGVYGSPENLLIRNLGLLVAALDATYAVGSLVWPSRSEEPTEAPQVTTPPP